MSSLTRGGKYIPEPGSEDLHALELPGCPALLSLGHPSTSQSYHIEVNW